MKSSSVIAYLCLLFVSCAGVTRSEQDVQQFYNAFRRAAIDGDVSRLTALTAFPFQTRGELDHDPIQYHNAEQFAVLVERILSERNVDNTKTVRDVLIHYPRIAPGDYQGSSESFRIENLVFERRRGRWQFTFAYLTLRGE
ncbi:MAG: hypothetical protein HS115_13105 [Spirochaetales bacterium]|nr:hypothetical protein [Spirochaetales bacterium]